MLVGDVMQQPVITCHSDDCLEQAACQMWEHDVGALVVIDHDGRPLAMLTDRDICMAAYTQGKDLKSLRVEGAMSRQLHSCAPYESPLLAGERMRRHRVRRLAVIAEGRLLGILSLKDLAHAALYEQDVNTRLRCADVTRTLGTLSDHRSQQPQAPEAAESEPPVRVRDFDG